MLGDPGIHKATYLHYTKSACSGKTEQYTEDSDEQQEEDQIEMADMEDKSESKENKVQKRREYRMKNLEKQTESDYYTPNYEQREDKNGKPI